MKNEDLFKLNPYLTVGDTLHCIFLLNVAVVRQKRSMKYCKEGEDSWHG